jgi:hypothetical protein
MDEGDGDELLRKIEAVKCNDEEIVELLSNQTEIIETSLSEQE